MEPVYSGPSTERIVRSLLLFLLGAVFAGAFLLDGYFGYAENNVRQLVKQLGLPDSPLPSANPKVTADAARAMVESAGKNSHPSDWTKRFGAPALERDGENYHLGPGGYLRLRIQGARVVKAEWFNGIHSETDIAMQCWIGLTLSVFSAGFFVNLVRVARFRVVVSEAGLRIGGSPVIPFHVIRGIRRDPASLTGRTSLECENGGERKAVVLDAYYVKRVDEVVAAVREGAGLPDEDFDVDQTSPEDDQPSVDEQNDESRA